MIFLNWFSDLSADAILKLVGLGGAFIAFLIALYQYRTAQRWKKSEFLANEYKHFISSDYVQKAFLFLDGYTINVAYVDTDGTTKICHYTEEKLLLALKNNADDPYNHRKYCTGADLTYIRLCIDKFLFKMGVFQTHLDGKLIRKKTLEPYLSYWLDLLTSKTDTTIPEETKKEIACYIHDNKLFSLIKLFKTFGYEIEKRPVLPEVQSGKEQNV